MPKSMFFSQFEKENSQFKEQKKNGRKNNKISPFYDVYVCGWKSGSEQSEWYKGNNQILQTPKR